MIKNICRCLILIILAGGCAGKKNIKDDDVATVAAGKDTIPITRKNISKIAVASYLQPMGDPKLDRKFGVEIFETPLTFKYKLFLYYDGIIETDTLSIPDFGIWPVVNVKPGTEKLSCIIGFLDGEKVFREYKLLSAKNNKLKLTSLKSYGVSTYYK